MKRIQIKKVIIHPLVLLGISDHQTRSNKEERVVGMLMGHSKNGIVDVMSSIAIPFEENIEENLFYLDQSYLEEIKQMVTRVNQKEVFVGWYSTSPQIQPNDVQIHEMMFKYTNNPVYLTVDIRNNDNYDLPVRSFIFNEINENEKMENEILKNEKNLKFLNVLTETGIDENEVGVKRLLKDLQQKNTTDLNVQVEMKYNSLKQLDKNIEMMKEYLENVINNKIPANQTILQNIQNMFNLSPNIENYIKQFSVNSNDVMVTIYLAQLVKSVLSVHDLIRNKNDYNFKVKEEKMEMEKKAKENEKNDKQEESNKMEEIK